MLCQDSLLLQHIQYCMLLTDFTTIDRYDRSLFVCLLCVYFYFKTKSPSKSRAPTERKRHVVMPYIKGRATFDAIKRTFGNYGVQVAFKPTRTLRQLLVAPKDKTEKRTLLAQCILSPVREKPTEDPARNLALERLKDY